MYNARWRMAARYEDTDANPMEQWVFHHAGLAESGSSSYIDSVILRDRDTTPTPDGVLNERVYYLQNWRADVVALIKDNGDQLEQVRYEPYGTPFGLPAGDIDSDGDFQSDDYIGITGSYDIRKDVNMDGTVSFADTTAAYNINGLQTLGRGTPTSTKINNRKTYAAYEHLSELAGAKYDVRNRVLIAELGTWSRRDPLGYVDGMNLYAYVMSMPLIVIDPSGLFVQAICCGVCIAAIATDMLLKFKSWSDCFAKSRIIDKITCILLKVFPLPALQKLLVCFAKAMKKWGVRAKLRAIASCFKGKALDLIRLSSCICCAGALLQQVINKIPLRKVLPPSPASPGSLVPVPIAGLHRFSVAANIARAN